MPEGARPDEALPELSRRSGTLCIEQCRLDELAARFGTPLYVYSRAAIAARMARLRKAFGADARICYAVKSNGNLSLLRLLHELGAGFDVVSGGEIARLEAAGIRGAEVVFAGVAKQPWEIDLALAYGVRAFHLESAHELPLLAAAATARGTRARIALRLNPDVDAGTHAYISTARSENKFGLDFASAAALVAAIRRDPALELVGYHVHLGSQVRSIEPYLEAFTRVEAFLDQDPAHREGVTSYDLGGGFAIPYAEPGGGLDVEALAAALLPRLAARRLQAVLEPGRFLVAEAGLLLTRVLGIKPGREKSFLLVDAAMNDLLRPALYGAIHPLAPVVAAPDRSPVRYDVVGPICESGDFLRRDVELAELRPGELLTVLCAGAYGASMASNYNSRPRAAEVLVEGAGARPIRARESLEDLWRNEASWLRE